MAGSKRSFGQFVTISDPARPAVARPASETAVAARISSSADVVVVLGGEGVGKTWAVARWWAAQANQPILLVAPALRVDLIDPRDSLLTLARLLAMQGEGDIGMLATRWLRRLRRWREREADDRGPRFTLLLDGLNESSATAWTQAILGLVPEVRRLGGQTITTCREGFWNWYAEPRLRGTLAVHSVNVGDYTEEELHDLLGLRGITWSGVPERVRSSMLNPRVCSVALTILDRLGEERGGVRPYELTVERLLLEYWRFRLEERGDLVAHDAADFDRLLRSHARAFLADPGTRFDRGRWRDHSGAARRDDGRRLCDDLTEIEEGRFLRLSPYDPGFYEFRTEIRPFAIGLLVARELAAELRRQGRDSSDALDV